MAKRKLTTARATPPDKPTLLIADDDPAAREAITDAFAADYTVLGASDGAAAAELLRDHRVDIALVDIRMPHVDGLQLLQEIRRRYSHIPVIMLTGVDDLQTAVAAMKAGAFDYVVKPGFDRIRTNLAEALQSRPTSAQAATKVSTLQQLSQHGADVILVTSQVGRLVALKAAISPGLPVRLVLTLDAGLAAVRRFQPRLLIFEQTFPHEESRAFLVDARASMPRGRIVAMWAAGDQEANLSGLGPTLGLRVLARPCPLDVLAEEIRLSLDLGTDEVPRLRLAQSVLRAVDQLGRAPHETGGDR